MGQSGRRSHVEADVLKYLVDRPGRRVFRDEIAAATHLHVDQVRRAMYQLAQKGEDVQTVISGQAWVYATPTLASNGVTPTETTPTGSALAALADGTRTQRTPRPRHTFFFEHEIDADRVLLKDGHGALWVAKRLVV